MGVISRLAIFFAMLLLTIVSMWTTYASLRDSVLPEPIIPIPLGMLGTWNCSIFALGLSVAIGLMLFALKLAIIDGQKRLNLVGIIGLTVVASVSITFNMDVLYRVGDREFYLRHATDKVKRAYDTYLAEVRASLLARKQDGEKTLARQTGELEAEIRGLREAPAGYGNRARAEDHRLTVLGHEVAVELAAIDAAIAEQEAADAILAGRRPENIAEVEALQDELRVAVKNAGALAGIAMPEPVALESPLFAVFERLFDPESVGWKEIFFLALAFLIDLGDIIGYSLVPAGAAASIRVYHDPVFPQPLPARRRRGPLRIPEDGYAPPAELPEAPAPPIQEPDPSSETTPFAESTPLEAENSPGPPLSFKRRGARFRL